jgi:hypothetical protein
MAPINTDLDVCSGDDVVKEDRGVRTGHSMIAG